MTTSAELSSPVGIRLLPTARRLLAELTSVWSVSGSRTAAAYTLAILRALPEVFLSRSLVPADRRMSRRRCTFSVHGHDLALDGRHFSGAREMYCRGVYFRTPGFIVRPYDTVVDLGANAGLFTTYAAKAGRRVLAVEAQSEFLPEIRRNLDENGCADGVTLLHALVGAETGVLSNDQRRARASHWKVEPPALSMGQLLEDSGISQVDLLKVDIEGSEFALLGDGGSWLDSVQRIAMEVHPEFGDPRDLLRLLEERDFSCRLLDNDGRLATSLRSSGYLFATSNRIGQPA